MPFLTREDLVRLLEEPVLPRLQAVPCPELGEDVSVYVRELSVPALELYERRTADIADRMKSALGMSTGVAADPLLSMDAEQAAAYLENAPSVRLELVMASACDAHGGLLFTREDAQWLGQQSPKMIRRLFTAAWELNGFSDAPERLQATIKNSESRQSNDSGTSSLSNGASPSALPSAS